MKEVRKSRSVNIIWVDKPLKGGYLEELTFR